MELTKPTRIRSLPHSLSFGTGLLLGTGLSMASGMEAPLVVVLIGFFLAFFVYGDLRGRSMTVE